MFLIPLGNIIIDFTDGTMVRWYFTASWYPSYGIRPVLLMYKGGKQKSPYIGARIGIIIGDIMTDYQQVTSNLKNTVYLLISGRHRTRLLNSDLRVKNSPKLRKHRPIKAQVS